MKVLILDIGNSKCKVYVFDTYLQAKYADKAQCVYECSTATPRLSTVDLIDACSTLMSNAINDCSPDIGMVTSFGDAFIKTKKDPHEFVFADESAEELYPYAYSVTGFSEGTQLTGIRRLRRKHNEEWEDILPINLYIASQLARNKSWNCWDWVQAAISGEYDIKENKWVNPFAKGAIICSPANIVGSFNGMPICAGGMDNAFINNESTQPYVIAGTWLVLGQPFKKFMPTHEQEKSGVRWVLDGNRYYNAQRVRKVSNPITDSEVERIVEDLKIVGTEPTKTTKLIVDYVPWSIYNKQKQKWGTNAVRVFGGYADELVEKLEMLNSEYAFTLVGPPERSDLYQHQQSALYVAKMTAQQNLYQHEVE